VSLGLSRCRESRCRGRNSETNLGRRADKSPETFTCNCKLEASKNRRGRDSFFSQELGTSSEGKNRFFGFPFKKKLTGLARGSLTNSERDHIECFAGKDKNKNMRSRTFLAAAQFLFGSLHTNLNASAGGRKDPKRLSTRNVVEM